MPHGDGALRRMRREVVPQPSLLGWAGAASADPVALRVDRDDVSTPEIEAVPAFAGRSGAASEVPEVAGCVRLAVFVVADHGVCDGLHAPPCRVVRLPEVVQRAAVVLQV